MSQARTARRRRKQMSMNNAQWSGMGIPRYGHTKDIAAQQRRLERKREKWAKTGSTLASS